jgi:predicted protein tyrosine phosphatase
MYVIVLPRYAVERGQIMEIQCGNKPMGMFPPKKKVAVISIVDTDSPKDASILAYEDSLVGVLRLRFDDVDDSYNKFRAITEEQARQVVDFVEGVIGRADVLVVHCEAGISRSAGTAAACSIMLGQTDQVFFSPPFSPNIKVYRTILNEWASRL